MSVVFATLAVALVGVAPAPRERTSAADSSAPWILRLRPHRDLWELGGFAGVLLPPDRHDLYDLDTRPPRRFAPAAPLFGARVGYFPIGWIGLEGEGEGAWAKLRAQGEPAFVWSARAHAVAQLPLFRVVPFLLGGYGVLGVRSPLAAVGTDLDPVGHFGVGVKLYLTRAIALRLDGRWLLGAAAARRRELAHWGSVSAGLSVTLGPGRAGSRQRGST